MGDLQKRIERRRNALYVALKQTHPDMYRRAVEVAHLSLIDFGGRDETKRATAVETAIISLLVEALNIDVVSPE